MDDWGATPEPKQYFLVLCGLNINILGIQKYLCWLVGCNGMGDLGAILEPKQYFLALCSSIITILGIQKNSFPGL